MKKFFKDNTAEYQYMPLQLMRKVFPNLKEIEDSVLEKQQWVVLHNYQDLNYSVQICFQNVPVNSNNSYLILIFDKNDDLFVISISTSHTVYPPVWNREFGGIDYMDFLSIQKKINDFLAKNNYPIMEYDFSLENRFHYFTQEKPEEIEELLKQGKSYSIIAIFAEKKPELAEQARKMMGI